MSLFNLTTHQSGVRLTSKEDTVIIEGSLDCQNPGEFLKPFINEVHSQAIRTNMKSINIDIKDLEFWNSVAFSEFTDWLLRLEEVPEEKRYTMTFLSNPVEHAWQKNSLQSLTFLCPDLVTCL